ncbi:hypothetical protein ACIGC1_27980 [Peribacillus butanolivorans]|uniref:hypothetical protein n=1 Tax=Peribacillus butanolivorans TaxID=421767 RepID=UPI0037C53A88
MNISKQNKMRKGLFIIVLFLIVSLILNAILFKNILSQGDKVRTQISEDLKEKDSKISGLEDTIKNLTLDINDSDPGVKEQTSNTELESQKAFKDVAKEFITAYLNYDSNRLKERREKIKPITTGNLLDKVAPETDGSESENQLSSDPTFTSKINDLSLYINDINKELKSGEIVADITYEAKSTEGKTKVRCFVYMEIQTEDDGTIKVNDYVYYPVN